jgi:TOBE domain-containing protein
VLRPDAVALEPRGALSGVVVARRFRGDHVSVAVRLAGAPDLHVEVRQGVPPHPGDAVRLAVDPSGAVIVGSGDDALGASGSERV